MKRNFGLLIVASIVLFGCATISGLFPSANSSSTTNIPQLPNALQSTAAENSAPTTISTLTPEPTTDPLILGERQVGDRIFFSFQAPWYYDSEINGSQVTIGDEYLNTIIVLLAYINQNSQTIEGILQSYLDGMGGDPDIENLVPGGFYYTTVDGREAIGSDISGELVGDRFNGRVLVAQTEDDLIFVSFGLAIDQGEPGDRWERETKEGFNAVISSIDFDLDE